MLYNTRGVNKDTVLLKVLEAGLADESINAHVEQMNKVYDIVTDATTLNKEQLTDEELNVLYQVFAPEFLTSSDEGMRNLHALIYDAIRYNIEINPDFQPVNLPAIKLDYIYPLPIHLYLKAYGLADEVYEGLTGSIDKINNFTENWDDITQPYLVSGNHDQYRSILEGYIKNIPSTCRGFVAELRTALLAIADVSEELLKRVCEDIGGELHYFKRDGIIELRILRLGKYRYIL